MALTTGEIHALTSAQIGALSTDDIASLSTDQVAALHFLTGPATQFTHMPVQCLVSESMIYHHAIAVPVGIYVH